MNAKQFELAYQIAASDKEILADDSHLFGCGLPDFKPVEVTINEVAKFIRYQCKQFNGEMDKEMVGECRYIARYKFICHEGENHRHGNMVQIARKITDETPYHDYRKEVEMAFEKFFETLNIKGF